MIYLDNAATSYPKPPIVYDTIANFLKTAGGNPGRTGYKLATEAARAIDETRTALAQLVNASDRNRVVFTLNATDALNMAIKGLLAAGGHVLTSVLEHNSVLRPLREIATHCGVTVEHVGVDSQGFVDPDDIRKRIRDNTRLIALIHGSNALGSLQDIRAVGTIARGRGVAFLVDASQTAGVVDIDMQRDCIDLLAFTGHKALFGPPGVGVLAVGPSIMLRQWRQGGTGFQSESDRHPETYPYHLEAGTLNTLAIAGLGAGVRFIQQTGRAAIRAHEESLVRFLLDALRAIPAVIVHGPHDTNRRTAAVSLTVKGWDPKELMTILDQSFGIACRGGLHCAPLAHQAIKAFPGGTLRFSPGYFNTMEDVQRAADALAAIVSERPI